MLGPNCMAKNFANEEKVVVNARKEIIKTIADVDNLNQYIILFIILLYTLE